MFCIYKDLDYLSYVDVTNIVAWFRHNGLVVNSDESHFLISPYEKISLEIINSIVERNYYEKLLGITNDNELTFMKISYRYV